jgi:hypothetical protein
MASVLGKKWLLVWNARELKTRTISHLSAVVLVASGLAWFNHFGMLAPLAVMGIFLTVKQWRHLWILYVVILSLAGSVAVFYVFGRYRFPLVPFLALFAGAGIVRALALYQEKNFRPSQSPRCSCCARNHVNWPIG